MKNTIQILASKLGSRSELDMPSTLAESSFPGPFDSLERLIEFEESLKDNPDLQRCVEHHFKLISSNDYRETILKIMRACFTDELACQFSYKGAMRKGISKHAFNKLTLKKLLMNVVQTVKYNFPNEEAVKEIAENWLRNATGRCQRQRREINIFDYLQPE